MHFFKIAQNVAEAETVSAVTLSDEKRMKCLSLLPEWVNRCDMLMPSQQVYKLI